MSKLWDFVVDNKKMVGVLVMLFIVNGLSYDHSSYSSKAEAYENLTNTFIITQNYHEGHSGIDIAQKLGAEILSLTDGKILRVGNEDKFCPHKGYGKFVMIEDSGSGITIMYAHLQDVFVEIGDKVERNDSIGTVGLTGLTTGPHIHLSIFKTKTLKLEKHACGERLWGETIDPESLL